MMNANGVSQSAYEQDFIDAAVKQEASDCSIRNFAAPISAPPIMSAANHSSSATAVVSQAQADYSSQQLANVLAFNSLLQHPQNSQLYSSPSTATASLSQQQVQAQQQQQQLYYTLMRLQAVQQMQQQQQFAAMMNGYSLSGLVPGLASGYPAGLIDSLTLPNQVTSGLTPNPYASAILQNQPALTNVAYINDEGQLLESLPICRDFKAGKCHRNTDCRYVHLIDENVEVNQGRVTVCRDSAKGRCTRVPCKYYHIPLFAISASRSLALNSALASAAHVPNGSSAGTATGSV